MAMGLTGASTLVRSVIKNFKYPGRTVVLRPSPRELRLDGEVYVLDRDEMVLHYVHEPVGTTLNRRGLCAGWRRRRPARPSGRIPLRPRSRRRWMRRGAR